MLVSILPSQLHTLHKIAPLLIEIRNGRLSDRSFVPLPPRSEELVPIEEWMEYEMHNYSVNGELTKQMLEGSGEMRRAESNRGNALLRLETASAVYEWRLIDSVVAFGHGSRPLPSFTT